MRWFRINTPLELRASWRRIRKCSQRRELLCQLLYPIPWRFQATPLPPTHDALMANAGAADPVAASASIQQRNIMYLHCIPLFRVRDTPLCSLYRLYEDLCSGDLALMGYESTYFFKHNEPSWRLSQIADPKDTNLVRYTVLASFVEALVAAFNWKIEEGLRRNGKHALEIHDKVNYPLFLEAPPSWTSRVKPLAETLNLLPPNCKDGVNSVFQKRNIVAPMGYLYSV